MFAPSARVVARAMSRRVLSLCLCGVLVVKEVALP